MPHITLPLLLLALMFSATAVAQDIRYISDKQYVPLRSGASNQHRIVHRGLPSGTKLVVSGTSSDGVWSEITTQGGQKGWVRTQYLMSEVPASIRLEAATRQIEQSGDQSAGLLSRLQELETERDNLEVMRTASETELAQVKQELHQLKQVSGKAVQLDVANRQLVEEAENLHSEVEMLQAENQRLTDNMRSEEFMNGALAVLLGVIIALVAPRLMPKRRKTSSW